MTAIVTPILEPPHAKQVILAMAGPRDETAPSMLDGTSISRSMSRKSRSTRVRRER